MPIRVNQRILKIRLTQMLTDFFNFVYLQIALDQTPPSPCRMSYAHPPTHVLKQALEAGFVVSCQAFVFATYAPDDGTVNRPNCR